MTLSASNSNLNNNLLKKKNVHKRWLKEHEIPVEFRDPFITDGYRTPGCTFTNCCESLFSVHNETVNIWSHLGAAILFGLYAMSELRVHSPFKETFNYPLLSFAVGIFTMLLMSTSAHLFNSMSAKVRHICFFLDYASISTYSFTAGLAFFFYSRPTNYRGFHPLLSAPIFLGVSALVSAGSTYLCCASRHKWIKYKSVIRTTTYSLSWFYNVLPFLWRAILCKGTTDCNPLAIRYFTRQFICFFVSALCNASKIPERFTPGWFNILGQSHHFMHILCALGSFDDFLAVKSDMVLRRELLISGPDAVLPTFLNSIILMVAVLSVNIAIVVWFAIKCPDQHSKSA